MARTLLLLLGGWNILTGLYIFVAPQHFYDSVPGVSMTGPFSIHFLRDVGLAYAASGAALLWGGRHYQRSTAIAGAGFVCLHALFHIQIWIARGAPLDLVTCTNLFMIQAPAWIALMTALKLQPQRTQV